MIAVIALAILALFLVLGWCAVAGWTVDSRDPGVGLWPFTGPPGLTPIPVRAAAQVRSLSSAARR